MPEKTDDLRYTQEQVDSLIEAAVQKAVTEAKSELSAEVDSLKSEQTVLTQRAETAESKLSEQLKAQEIDAANGLIDEAIKSGKLLPKQRTFALAALTALKDQTIKLSSDDGPRDMSMAEAFREFLSEAGVVVDKATHTDVDDDADADRDKSYVSATQELDAKVKMALKESPDRFKTYGEAFDFVLSDDEKLAARYHSETITTVQ